MCRKVVIQAIFSLEHPLALPAGSERQLRRLNSTGTQQRVAPGSRNAFRGAHYQSVLYVVTGHQRLVLGIRRCVYSTSLHCGLSPTSACKQTTRPANKQSSACKAERTEYMSKHARMNWVPCNCLPPSCRPTRPTRPTRLAITRNASRCIGVNSGGNDASGVI